MTKPKPGAVRGRPQLPPEERRVLVKVSLLPSTIDDLERLLEQLRKAQKSQP